MPSRPSQSAYYSGRRSDQYAGQKSDDERRRLITFNVASVITDELESLPIDGFNRLMM